MSLNDPKITQEATATQSIHYDDDGQVLSTTDSQNRTITHDLEIDENGNKTQTTTYATGVAVVTESDCCHVLNTSDENGKTTYYDYDDAGRLTKTWTSLSGQSANAPLVANEYDEFGAVWRVTTRSDASTTRQTSYTLDKLGRVTAVDNPSPMGDEEVGYDNYGNQLWKEDGKGIVTLYKYDTLNRVTDVYYNYTGSLTTISYPGTADVSYTYYGGSGIRAKVVDSAGTSKYAYNVLRQMTTYTAPQPSNRSISYTYNNLGQKTSAGYGGMTINYEYFANGWLKAVKKGANMVASYSYDTSGNRTRVDFGCLGKCSSMDCRACE